MEELYDLGDVVGEGSSGDVVAATRKADGLCVVMKIINKAKLLARGRREAEVLRGLKGSEGIVEFVDAFETNDGYVIVLERYDFDLYDLIWGGGPMESAVGRDVMMQLVRAVRGLHERGIAHLDLKLENVLIKKKGDRYVVGICDFGFATRVVEGRLHTKYCGSPDTVAPEIIRQKPYSPMAADVWAMGCVFFCILNGQYPFAGSERSMTLFRNILDRRTRRYREEVGPEARRLLDDMLSLDPDDRPSLAEVALYSYFLSGERGQA